jgi:predicted nucleic acid-binding protein
VLAELDDLVATRIGEAAERALLGEVARGAYQLEPFAAGDVAEANDLIERYSGTGLGLADASVLVLSRRHRVGDLLTLDERHFRLVVSDWLPSSSLRILPADERR